MASHDLSNTKTAILGATPGAIPRIDENPHERFSFAPSFSERFFENWGGPRVQEIFGPMVVIFCNWWGYAMGRTWTQAWRRTPHPICCHLPPQHFISCQAHPDHHPQIYQIHCCTCRSLRNDNRFLDYTICTFKILLSWRFSQKKKQRFGQFSPLPPISPPPPISHPPQNRKFYFQCRLAVSEFSQGRADLLNLVVSAAFPFLFFPWRTDKEANHVV